MIKQECIGIPDMILLLMNFFVSKKIKIKAEIVLSPGGAYFINPFLTPLPHMRLWFPKSLLNFGCDWLFSGDIEGYYFQKSSHDASYQTLMLEFKPDTETTQVFQLR